jgi:tetratricopeptide (TPR) repeat protein
LELDPASADAHAALGLVKYYTYDYEGSLEQFKQALKLNPNHATAHHWYGVELRDLNHMTEAREQLRLAEELDPLSPVIKFNLLAWYIYAREYDQGLDLASAYQKVFPDSAMLRTAVAWFYAAKGQFAEAIDQMEKFRSTNSGPELLAHLSYCYARSGNEVRAREILSELDEYRKKGYSVYSLLSVAHIGLREYDKALDCCFEAYEKHEAQGGIINDPVYDEIRGFPRFQEFLQKLGLAKPVNP